MARNHDSLISRSKPAPHAVRLEEPEWRENMRDFGLMVSGVYQDLRGDAYETWRHFTGWIKDSLHKPHRTREK